MKREASEAEQEVDGPGGKAAGEIAAGPIARAAVAVYLRLKRLAPRSTRGRLSMAVAAVLLVLLPSIVLLYLSIEAGRSATERWFADLGYAGVFLANLASTGTVFIPVPGLTATAQALIASSAETLDPLMVGVLGGLGMAAGEVTAYIAGMAGAEIARDEHLTAPRPLRPQVERAIRTVERLMSNYGMPTLFALSLLPNLLFEFAGISAGATRYAFWKFCAAVALGKVGRALIIAYVGRRLIFG